MVVEKPLKRKEQIHLIATHLFNERGYLATSMRDLAKELKIEAPSLYSHIKSKEEILQKVCFETATHFFEGLKDVEKQNFSAKARLNAGIHSHIKIICENIDSVSVFLNEWRHMSEPYYSDFLKMRKDYENMFRNYLVFGIDKGEFNIQNVDFAVLTILSSINWTHNWYKSNGNMKPKEIAESLSEILIKGIS